MILVIDDEKAWLEMVEGNALVAVNAKDGLEVLATQPITKVLCDFHGIQKDGKTAHDVVKFCIANKIPCLLTTSDPVTQGLFETTYGIDCISKMNMIDFIKKQQRGAM